MPTFLVRFPSTVVYLKGHPKGERRVTELTVTAPDAHRAIVHAIRVVDGEVGEPTAEEVFKSSPPPPVEAQTTQLG